jgi:NAD(P)-dependent dehydrogenase (short-subunit alcohol dehydrogenase family)
VTQDVAVVVGATGAIGSAVVGRLVDKGLEVLAVARHEAALAGIARAQVHPCVADIGTDAAVAAVGAGLAAVMAGSADVDGPGSGVGVGLAGRRLRLVVFAAGLPVRGSVETIEPSMLGVGVDIKVGGVLRLVRAAGPYLSPGSRIVTFAGSLGLEPRGTEAGPGVVNAAVFNLMRQLSIVHGPRGVTTHTISPGPADTPRLRRIVEAVAAERGESFDAVWASYAAENTLRRLPTAREVAWGVELLLADEADLLHGSVLYLDAGGHRAIT